LVFSLLSGYFFVPAEVIAQTNSQNLELLQANVSLSTIQNQDLDLNVITEGALLPLVGPAGVADGTEDGNISSDEMSLYVVRKGDSTTQIATMFNISVNTILWANDMKKGDKLKEGEVLIILPIDGVKHIVAKGETLKGIATKYKADIADIARFNGIPEDGVLTVGDELIIPDAEIIDIDSQKPKTNLKQTVRTPLKVLNGYFINPVPNYRRISQRKLHGHNGVDLAAPTGTSIVATASGTVIFARSGYNGGYGTMVIIQHPNGTQTLYGHMSKLNTHSGAQVNQGQTIGYVGSTGRSTGPHLHYEIRGARNNAVDLP
jgi:LysM repeat protein